MKSSLYLLITYVPKVDADRIRKVIADAGGGAIGLYDSCSFSSEGIGRFRPLNGANPTIGSVEKEAIVTEERIECVMNEHIVSSVLQAISDAHPYEEPAIHVLPMIDYKDLL